MTENTITDDRAQIGGFVADGFEPVRAAFIENFEKRGEVGASVGVYVDGKAVVDLWGGYADPKTERPWKEHTVTLVYSATKGATAILAHRLAQQGILDLDAPVATYWPEFAQAGKGGITVRQVLSHQAGLPVPDEPLTLEELLDGTSVEDALARQTPLWEPGTAFGYHLITYGWLVQAIVRRATGRSVGQLFESEFTEPLGLDLKLGLADMSSVDYAPIIDGIPDPSAMNSIEDPDMKALVVSLMTAAGDPESLLARAISTNGVMPAPSARVWNAPEVLAAEIPSGNGVTNGRSLARLYGSTVAEVDGVRTLDAETIEDARAEQVYGADRVLIGTFRLGSGFQLDHSANRLLGPTSFGHVGAGGALGFADVQQRVGFGWAQNQLGSTLIGEARTDALIDALRSCLS
jgi:CubicO group peptidase (beta-lactamase class C family)